MFGLCASRARMREPLPARWPAAPLSRVAPGNDGSTAVPVREPALIDFWLRYEDILYRQPAAQTSVGLSANAPVSLDAA